ncbi:hypothetical protein F0223_13455 [Vibrio coralliilyticus]|nr:hypothetical protein [Vibrio coralliilyticus]
MLKTLICRSTQSFLDMCDNKLVSGANVHCTFKLLKDDATWMQEYLIEKGGKRLSVTLFLQDI